MFRLPEFQLPTSFSHFLKALFAETSDRLGDICFLSQRLPSKVPASAPVHLRQRAFDLHEVLILAHSFVAILDHKACCGAGFIRVV